MTRYLLDTNHASVVWKNDAKLRARIENTADAEFCLCLPSIGELWFMVMNSAQVERNEPLLEVLLNRFALLDFDMAASKEFGRIRTDLRRIGQPIPAIDAQIAAIAIVSDAVLLTSDNRHFPRVVGLRLENWLV